MPNRMISLERNTNETQIDLTYPHLKLQQSAIPSNSRPHLPYKTQLRTNVMTCNYTTHINT